MTPSFVHPSASVESGARLGDGVRVWHNAHIREGAIVGDETIIGKDVYVDSGVLVGARCKVQNGAQLFSGARLGAGVFVGPGAILTNDLFPRATDKEGKLKTAKDWDQGQIVVGEGASLGAGVVILTGVEVGEWAMAGAGSVVTRNVPPHALVLGAPARSVGHVCFCGKPAKATCPTCGWGPR